MINNYDCTNLMTFKNIGENEMRVEREREREREFHIETVTQYAIYGKLVQDL